MGGGRGERVDGWGCLFGRHVHRGRPGGGGGGGGWRGRNPRQADRRGHTVLMDDGSDLAQTSGSIRYSRARRRMAEGRTGCTEHRAIESKLPIDPDRVAERQASPSAFLRPPLQAPLVLELHVASAVLPLSSSALRGVHSSSIKGAQQRNRCRLLRCVSRVMVVRIRLQRHGRIHRPFYRIAVADSHRHVSKKVIDYIVSPPSHDTRRHTNTTHDRHSARSRH